MAVDALVAELEKRLSKKISFESAVAELEALFRERYGSASPSEQAAMCKAASRAASLLQARYTARGFWSAGLRLFEQAQAVVSTRETQKQMAKYVEQARSFLGEEDQQQNETRAAPSSPYLFEGQLTVGPEPPAPAWMRAQNAIAALALASQDTSDAASQASTSAVLNDLLGGLQDDFFPGLEEAIQSTMQDLPKGPPPASKEEVAKLPVLEVTEKLLKDIGDATECAVCREAFVLKDEMQQMPCKHYFHPPCLKPWLDEHNSCPVCRHEMRTDDHHYESRKEREKEEELARKGAANAVRDNFMYI